MPLSHESVIFDIHDLKIYKMTADSTAASPVYDSGLDVPGIAELTLDPDLTTAVLRGDAREMASKSRFNKFNGSITWGKIDLDVLAAVLGGTVDDNGTTPNMTAEWELLASDVSGGLPYWKLMAALDDTDESMDQIVVTLFKCQMTGGSFMGASTDNFSQPTMDFSVNFPLFATTPIIKVTAEETGSTLSGS